MPQGCDDLGHLPPSMSQNGHPSRCAGRAPCGRRAARLRSHLMSEAILVTEKLTKRFRLGLRRREVRAVEDLDLSVRKGEIYGFLGPNGAGKSTTIKMLVGLVTPTSGSARRFVEPIASRKARRCLGYLPENPYFHDFLTPRQLLHFHGRLCGLSSGELADRVPRLLDLVGLSRAM